MITAAIVKTKPDLDALVRQLFNDLKVLKGWLRCEACGEVGPAVEAHGAMTAYHWDKEKQPVNPNRDVVLCADCWHDYEMFWIEQWGEYNRSRG